jgi:hypothetical protein
VHSLPAVFPFRVSKKAIQHLGIEIALTFEVGIEATVREPRTRHDLSDRYIFETMAIEQSTGAVDDPLPLLCTMTSGIRHRFPPELAVERALRSCSPPAQYYIEHILL